MNRFVLPALSVAMSLLGSQALAADPAPKAARFYMAIDKSSDVLVTDQNVADVWREAIPAKLLKLYPVKKYGFLTEVEGGFTSNNTCVVTARAMMLPRKGNDLVFKPVKMATTFDLKANATAEQCREVAKAKRKEAVNAVVAALGS